MLREELKERFLELGKEYSFEEKDFEQFIEQLVIPISFIKEINCFELTDEDDLEKYFSIDITTIKASMIYYFKVSKKNDNSFEEKKNYINQLLDKINKEEKRKEEEENQKFLYIQSKILKVCSRLNEELGETLGIINEKYNNLEFCKEIFNYGNESFRITLRGREFYLTRYLLGDLYNVYWEFADKDIEELKRIFNKKPKDFNEQDIINRFYELLDRLIKKLEEDCEKYEGVE